MHENRFALHHKASLKGEKPILYWLQNTHRIDQNYALYEALRLAHHFNTHIEVVFILTPGFKDANARHYAFMLEGLKSLFKDLESLEIKAMLKVGSFLEVMTDVLPHYEAIILDKGYQKELREARKHVIEMAVKHTLYVCEVESDLIVPIEQASDKLEYAARTIRPKLLKQKDTYLKLYNRPKVSQPMKHHESFFDQPLDDQLAAVSADRSVSKSPYFEGGEAQAHKRFEQFLAQGLKHYAESNDPGYEYTSKMSPYLHFNMISPVRMMLMCEDYLKEHPEAQESVEGYLEQLLVRRELAFNFIYFEPGYDVFETMTYAWAYETMKKHEEDTRDYLYTQEDYVHFKTHDPYFNAAMREMVKTGYMHNYMRMYWAKKIIEWSPDYHKAYQTILTLNNRYFIDGENPNSYTGVAWCFGRHDRPWTERKVFGKLRYMNAEGLKRKFDIEAYVKRTKQL